MQTLYVIYCLKSIALVLVPPKTLKIRSMEIKNNDHCKVDFLLIISIDLLILSPKKS